METEETIKVSLDLRSYLNNGGTDLAVQPTQKLSRKRNNSNMEDPERVRVTPQKLYSTWNDPQILGIIVAIVAVVVTFIVYSIYKKSLTRKNGILFLGLCEAGKTLIFARLVYKKFVQTHTSVKENAGEYACGPASIFLSFVYNIVDIPGHERLRNRFFDQFKPLAKGLVFVIDSLTIQKDIRDVAEFLYHCLTDSYVVSNMPPLLILCNKQSEALAKSSSIIKMLLEKEMNILRKTQTSQLESLAKTGDSVFLGKEGKDFEFSHLSPMKVEFAECSAIIGQDESNFNLSALEDWLKSLA